jgi:hypothetical protein
MGLSYLHAKLHRLAGRYNNPMPESTISPRQGRLGRQGIGLLNTFLQPGITPSYFRTIRRLTSLEIGFQNLPPFSVCSQILLKKSCLLFYKFYVSSLWLLAPTYYFLLPKQLSAASLLRVACTLSLKSSILNPRGFYKIFVHFWLYIWKFLRASSMQMFTKAAKN